MKKRHSIDKIAQKNKEKQDISVLFFLKGSIPNVGVSTLIASLVRGRQSTSQLLQKNILKN